VQNKKLFYIFSTSCTDDKLNKKEIYLLRAFITLTPIYCKANHDDTATPAAIPCSLDRTKLTSLGAL
jgi:hypothetical protein